MLIQSFLFCTFASRFQVPAIVNQHSDCIKSWWQTRWSRHSRSRSSAPAPLRAQASLRSQIVAVAMATRASTGDGAGTSTVMASTRASAATGTRASSATCTLPPSPGKAHDFTIYSHQLLLVSLAKHVALASAHCAAAPSWHQPVLTLTLAVAGSASRAASLLDSAGPTSLIQWEDPARVAHRTTFRRRMVPSPTFRRRLVRHHTVRRTTMGIAARQGTPTMEALGTAAIAAACGHLRPLAKAPRGMACLWISPQQRSSTLCWAKPPASRSPMLRSR